MATHSPSDKAFKIVLSIAAIIIIALILTLLFLSSSNQKTVSLDSYAGNWENSVIPSESLEYTFESDFDSYTRSSIDSGLDEYFLSIYPTGTGLNLIEYNEGNSETGYSLRLISSYGTFHTLTISRNEGSTTIKLDDNFEKDYPIVVPEREEDIVEEY